MVPAYAGIVLIDRASRVLWEVRYGQKERSLFEAALHLLCQIVEHPGDLTLLTDGERREGNLLFELCQEVLRTGKPGRPKKVFPEGVKVRLKNKGSQAHKRGRKRPRYEAPWNEHPDTQQNLEDSEIHANPTEGFNGSVRRKVSCYPRRTNPYAKEHPALQTRLDAYWVLHNFVRPHFTTKQVRAVGLGILEPGLSLKDIFRIQYIRQPVPI